MSRDYKVYVLENADGRRYIGLSEDVAKRLIPACLLGISIDV